MKSKVTVSIDSKVVARAKAFVKKEGTSLSALIENYLNKLTDRNVVEEETTPIVKSLVGVAKVRKNYNWRKDYTRFLEKKYK